MNWMKGLISLASVVAAPVTSFFTSAEHKRCASSEASSAVYRGQVEQLQKDVEGYRKERRLAEEEKAKAVASKASEVAAEMQAQLSSTVGDLKRMHLMQEHFAEVLHLMDLLLHLRSWESNYYRLHGERKRVLEYIQMMARDISDVGVRLAKLQQDVAWSAFMKGQASVEAYGERVRDRLTAQDAQQQVRAATAGIPGSVMPTARA
jgi:DNA-binding transcriptional regulator YiaG